MTIINYYFNQDHPLRPFTGSDYANKDSFAPVNALRVASEETPGFWPCERDGAWIMIPDHRGTKVYDITTAQESEINELGELPDGVTTIAPDVDFPKWNGKKWVTDKAEKKAADIAAAEAQKQALIAEASQKTQLWQTQLMLGIITEEDKVSLKEWMLYVQQVQAVDPSLGAGVVWPTPPASPAR
ncbi:tail fiber assembly protein [Morganella morganii]|uniref:tail fiber assembly protein n=1 Tax=Morganella morganii TaxID=582 RepID=UPI001648F478|nr:tail fiber assembly protein [Morganella morganii]MBC3970591.1 tail fiber assembly protein [Morganella morganii]